MLLTWFYLFSAEAARKNFDAERGLAREIVQDLGVVPEDQEIDPHTLSDEEVEHIEEEDFCSIPKKPLYDFDDTPETFQQKEIDSFWKWKRTLSRLQAKNPKVTIMAKFCPSKFTLIYFEADFTGGKINQYKHILYELQNYVGTLNLSRFFIRFEKSNKIALLYFQMGVNKISIRLNSQTKWL